MWGRERSKAQTNVRSRKRKKKEWTLVVNRLDLLRRRRKKTDGRGEGSGTKKRSGPTRTIREGFVKLSTSDVKACLPFTFKYSRPGERERERARETISSDKDSSTRSGGTDGEMDKCRPVRT